MKTSEWRLLTIEQQIEVCRKIMSGYPEGHWQRKQIAEQIEIMKKGNK